MNRLMIAGTGSGCGKTTVTCALLAAFLRRHDRVVSFKCGPDYIDPMFHKKACGTDSYNLDAYLMGEENVSGCLRRNGQGAALSVIEGVMGFYDGVAGGDYSSANHISRLTETPVVLVADAKGKAQSVCAEISGFLSYRENNIRAVILNNVTAAMYPFYRDMIAGELPVEAVGFMPHAAAARIESRHLGLVTAGEISDIQAKLSLLGDSAEECIDLDRLYEIAASAAPLETEHDFFADITPEGAPNIYVSDDEAFCFYYEDNLALLRAYGARLRSFSPLNDAELPSDADGVILWGGYPELWAERLSRNETMKDSLRRKIGAGMPVYAECGGFIYLQQTVTDTSGKTLPMLGVIKGNTTMKNRPQNFGYAELTANCDNMLCGKGGRLKIHSFHYSESDNEGAAFTARKTRGGEYPCIYAEGNIFAGYPHIHFWGAPQMAGRLVSACAEYGRTKNGVHLGTDGDRAPQS